MKKKLIAIAVATASVMSGVANAESSWVEASTGGTIDIGGTIEVDSQYDDLWTWKLGDAITVASNAADMNAEKTSLTITMEQRKPLLVGKSEPFKAPSTGVGASPSISFSDADGNEVALQTPATPSQGKASLTLPIKDESKATIGSLTLNVQAIGVMYTQSTNASYGGPHAMTANNVGNIFHGGLPTSAAGLNGSTAVNIVASDGGWTVTEMMNKWNEFTGQNKSWIQTVHSYGSSGMIDALYNYSLSIAQGQTLEAEFDSPVTTTTKWSAPLTISIAYN